VRVLDISFNPLRRWPKRPLNALAATLRSLTTTDCRFRSADVTGLLHVRWLGLARNRLRAPPVGLAGVATGGGTIAGSANGVAEDDGKGGDDQDEWEGVDMDGGVDGGDTHRAAG